MISPEHGIRYVIMQTHILYLELLKSNIKRKWSTDYNEKFGNGGKRHTKKIILGFHDMCLFVLKEPIFHRSFAIFFAFCIWIKNKILQNNFTCHYKTNLIQMRGEQFNAF